MYRAIVQAEHVGGSSIVVHVQTILFSVCRKSLQEIGVCTNYFFRGGIEITKKGFICSVCTIFFVTEHQCQLHSNTLAVQTLVICK
jgi:hypothetical protein